MEHQKDPTSAHQEQGTAPFSIMVISADPTQLKLLSMALQLEWRCEVRSMESVQQAEQRIEELPCDLVILEALLLDQAPLQIAQRLRQVSRRSKLPLLVLNADVASQSEQLLCLTRSWKMSALYDAIRQLLGLPA